MTGSGEPREYADSIFLFIGTYHELQIDTGCANVRNPNLGIHRRGLMGLSFWASHRTRNPV